MASGTISFRIPYIDTSLAYVDSETMLQKVQRLYNTGILPTNKAFIGRFLCGSYYYISGCVYIGAGNQTYGSIFCSTYNEGDLFMLNNGTFSSMFKQSLGTISSTHTIDTSLTKLVRSGNIVMLTLNVTLKADVSSYGTIATIPGGYRPYAQIWCESNGIAFDITGSGNIRLINSATSGRSIAITATYIRA